MHPYKLSRADEIFTRAEAFFQQQVLEGGDPRGHFRHHNLDLFDQIVQTERRLNVLSKFPSIYFLTNHFLFRWSFAGLPAWRHGYLLGSVRHDG